MKGLERFLLGSDAEAVLGRRIAPVLSVGPAVPNLPRQDVAHTRGSLRNESRSTLGCGCCLCA